MMTAVAHIADRQIDKFVLTRIRGPDAAGIFQIATSLTAGPSMLAGLPAGLLLAGTAELVRSDPDKLDRLRRLTEKATYSGAFFLAGGVVVLVPSFVDLWLGPDYSEVAGVSRILVVAAVAGVIGYPWYFYAMGRGWQGIVVTSAMVSLGINLVGTLALTPGWGPQGAAIGSLLGAIGSTLTIFHMLRRRDANTSARQVLRPLLIVGLAVGAGLLVMPAPTLLDVLGRRGGRMVGRVPGSVGGDQDVARPDRFQGRRRESPLTHEATTTRSDGAADATSARSRTSSEAGRRLTA